VGQLDSSGAQRGPTSVCTDGIAAVLAAMRRKGVRRLLAGLAPGATARSPEVSLDRRLQEDQWRAREALTGTADVAR
jgi:hypothetical protein